MLALGERVVSIEIGGLEGGCGGVDGFSDGHGLDGRRDCLGELAFLEGALAGFAQVVESVDGIRCMTAIVLLMHQPAILVRVRANPVGVVVMVHVLHPRRSRHFAAAMLFKLVVHLAHVTQVLTDALNATKQCSTAVDMRVSRPA